MPAGFQSPSLRLDVARPDHLAPLLGLIPDKLGVGSWRACQNLAGQVGEPRLDLWIGGPALISPFSLSMTAAGVFFGLPKPNWPLASKPGTESPTVGMSGSAPYRVAVVTASGRSLPALICSIDEDMLSNITCT